MLSLLTINILIVRVLTLDLAQILGSHQESLCIQCFSALFPTLSSCPCQHSRAQIIKLPNYSNSHHISQLPAPSGEAILGLQAVTETSCLGNSPFLSSHSISCSKLYVYRGLKGFSFGKSEENLIIGKSLLCLTGIVFYTAANKFICFRWEHR